jgi:hypothetical protein
MPTTATVTVKRFEQPDEVRQFAGHGHADAIDIGGRTVLRGTFEPGWRWSQDVKPIAQTDSCQVSHLGYVVSGRMRILMDDGGRQELGPGDAVAIPPGHDAEVLGDEACVFLDFGEVAEYAKH